MKRSRKVIIAVVAAVVILAIATTGAAFAYSGNEDGGARQPVLERVAQKLGIGTDQLQKAFDEAHAELVEEGVIPERAGGPRGDIGRFGGADMAQTGIAEALGMDVETVQIAFADARATMQELGSEDCSLELMRETVAANLGITVEDLNVAIGQGRAAFAEQHQAQLEKGSQFGPKGARGFDRSGMMGQRNFNQQGANGDCDGDCEVIETAAING